MPRQYFAADATSAPSAAITWESSFTNVEVAFGHTIVTRIPNADPLRTTGLAGQGPDGSSLTLHLVNGPNGEQFVLTRNGAPMLGGSIAWTAAGTPLEYPAAASWAPAGVVSTSGPAGGTALVPGGARADASDEKTMKSARTWLLTLGVLAAIAGFSVALLSGSIVKEVAKNPQLKDVDASGLKVIGLVAGVVGLLYIVLSRMAYGKRAKTMFLVGAVITGLNAVANVFQLAQGSAAGVIGIAISAVAAIRCFKAYKVAKKLNP